MGQKGNLDREAPVTPHGLESAADHRTGTPPVPPLFIFTEKQKEENIFFPELHSNGHTSVTT